MRRVESARTGGSRARGASSRCVRRRWTTRHRRHRRWPMTHRWPLSRRRFPTAWAGAGRRAAVQREVVVCRACARSSWGDEGAACGTSFAESKPFRNELIAGNYLAPRCRATSRSLTYFYVSWHCFGAFVRYHEPKPLRRGQQSQPGPGVARQRCSIDRWDWRWRDLRPQLLGPRRPGRRLWDDLRPTGPGLRGRLQPASAGRHAAGTGKL